ncbi:MAG: UDP-N-acetylmuramate--L-alanine ligase [Chloroflexota bacterium]|nr:UDP-N-acetylmuramate--L-alanine ligase [Chloroflexota bacterium]
MTEWATDVTRADLLDQKTAPSTHIHLVGVGGAGMSAIARILVERGFQVSGSDLNRSAMSDELAELGATVFLGHRASQVSGANLVLISSAIPEDNEESLAARDAGIPVVKRREFLGPLMTGYRQLCVAGTHGKTTTSAMLATLLDGIGAEPSFIVGSQILALGTAARSGRPGGPFVVEADEYDRMFLGLSPEVALVTNIEWDHIDCYPKTEDYQAAFVEFVGQVSPDGVIVYCGDDAGAGELRSVIDSADHRWISYGLGQDNDWRARRLAPNATGGSDFEVWQGGSRLGTWSLPLPGEHNVRNVLGSVAAAAVAGYNVFTEPYKNLKISTKMAGTARRLEQKGKSCGIIVLDDYAHHPTEVRATLSAVRQRFPRRDVWVLFQPHTFSRTRAMLTDFYKSFENADHVLITDIYAAREHDTMGVSASDLVTALRPAVDARYAGDLGKATGLFLEELREGDVLITMGAGDVTRVGDQVLSLLREREQHSVEDGSVQKHVALSTEIARATGLAVRHDEPLAAHTTMRIGGPAELFVVAGSSEQLLAITRLATEVGVPHLILGGGSNILVSDAGVRGLVILNASREVRRHEGNVVWAESGVNLAGLARQAMRWGLAGLEWGVSVPGTIGGAVVGNAGAHGGAIADCLLRAMVWQNGTLVEWPLARFQYGYRYSRLKEAIGTGDGDFVVLSAAFELTPDDPDAINARAAEYLAHRRATQPVEPSSGSLFQNPPGDFAGRILESLGLKGRRLGNAGFSEVHANFVVNYGGASAADVIGLIDLAREAAWQDMGVELVPEILFVGDWSRQPSYQELSLSVEQVNQS